jgi:anti-anti-sigma factor
MVGFSSGQLDCLSPKAACRLAFCGKEVRVSHSIRVKKDPGGCQVEVAGDIDSTASDDLIAALEVAAGGDESAALVVIDLSEANFVDSRCMGILADWQARIRAAGGRLAIVGARPQVVRLFTMIGLEQAFEFFPTVDAARENAN